jgi:hypothetical protein
METSTEARGETCNFLVSSTGMLHHQGCGSLTPTVSVARLVNAETAAKVAKRCKHCGPRPLGTVVTQADRKAMTQALKAEAEAEHAARLAAQDAAWTAQQSPELDDLLRTFWAAMVAEEAGTGSLEDAKVAFQAMRAAAPADWNHARRASELGLPRR